MKYLIIDTQNLFHRAIFVTRGDAEQKATLGLHIMISSIAAAWKLFDADHIVFTLEGRSWRKTIYEEYKANRKIAQLQKMPREKEDDEVIFSMLNEFISFLENKTNTTVLRCKSTEADDLIARWTQLHPSEHHLIVSSDKDFHQLISPNISQYDGVNKKIYEDKNTEIKVYDSKNILEKEIIEDPEYVLFKKIVRGDPSDNVMSAYPGVREKGTRDKIGIKEAYSDRKNKGFSWEDLKGLDRELVLRNCVDSEVGLHVFQEAFKENKTLF